MIFIFAFYSRSSNMMNDLFFASMSWKNFRKIKIKIKNKTCYKWIFLLFLLVFLPLLLGKGTKKSRCYSINVCRYFRNLLFTVSHFYAVVLLQVSSIRIFLYIFFFFFCFHSHYSFMFFHFSWVFTMKLQTKIEWKETKQNILTKILFRYYIIS